MSVRDRVLDSATSVFRLLPKGRTTAHRGLWRLLGAPPTFVGRVQGAWFAVDALDTDISTTIYLWQEWEPPASAVWRALLRPGQVVVDVGANKGWFSLLAAQVVGRDGRVISYEPLPRNVRDLNQTAIANRWDWMTVRPVGLSGTSGTAGLVSPEDESGSGWGSFEKPLGDHQVSLTVETVTLDDELHRLGIATVDLLKMDIEGHEFEALRGAAGALAAGKIKRLLVEVHANHLGPERTAAIHENMTRAGYTASLLDTAMHSEAEWRRLFAQGGEQPVSRMLVPLHGATDPKLDGKHWYKVLWEHGSAQ
jgi:FkbM family methyltransferase